MPASEDVNRALERAAVSRCVGAAGVAAASSNIEATGAAEAAGGGAHEIFMVHYHSECASPLLIGQDTYCPVCSAPVGSAASLTHPLPPLI